MATITELPDLAKQLEKLKLILDLEENADEKTMIGLCILKAIREKKTPNYEILRFVKDQATDSPETMAKCIGEELTNLILNFKL